MVNRSPPLNLIMRRVVVITGATPARTTPSVQRCSTATIVHSALYFEIVDPSY